MILLLHPRPEKNGKSSLIGRPAMEAGDSGSGRSHLLGGAEQHIFEESVSSALLRVLDESSGEWAIPPWTTFFGVFEHHGPKRRRNK